MFAAEYHRAMCVSIHAPVWGATNGKILSMTITQCFNPRTRVGCDMRHVERAGQYMVSIHAPVWGATRYKGVAKTPI